jgi:hypothetical protein
MSVAKDVWPRALESLREHFVKQSLNNNKKSVTEKRIIKRIRDDFWIDRPEI